MDDLTVLPGSSWSPGIEGLFDIPAALYHNHTAAPGISRTLIVELLQASPAHLKSLLDGTFTKRVTPEMQGGTFIDHALLEPHKFKEGETHFVVPSKLKLSTKDGIQWKKDHPGLPYLRATSDAAGVVSLEDIKGMMASVMAHKKARRIIEESSKQESAFCIDPDTGLMRKVRPDARLVDNNSRVVLGDLKSIFRGGTAEYAFRNHCARKAYHIQDALYSDVYKDLIGEKPFFLFMVVERKPPYAVRLFQIDPEGKECARNKYKLALEQIKRCQDAGVWPAFNEEIITISLPSWELQAPDPEPIEL